MARVASQRFCFTENVFFAFFLYHMIIFPHLFELKKTRIEMLRRSVKFSARELRSETTSCIFGWCPHQNNPRLSWSLNQPVRSFQSALGMGDDDSHRGFRDESSWLGPTWFLLLSSQVYIWFISPPWGCWMLTGSRPSLDISRHCPLC